MTERIANVEVVFPDIRGFRPDPNASPLGQRIFVPRTYPKGWQEVGAAMQPLGKSEYLIGYPRIRAATPEECDSINAQLAADTLLEE